MPHAWNVCGDFGVVRQPDSRNLAHCRVGLPGSHHCDGEAHAALLRCATPQHPGTGGECVMDGCECPRLALALRARALSRLSNKLVQGRQFDGSLRIPMLVKRLCVYAFQVSLAIIQAIPRSLNDSSYNNPRQDSRRSFMNSESRCMKLSRSRASMRYPYARSIIIVQRSMPTDSRVHHLHLAHLRSCGIDRSTALRNDLFTLT